MNAVLRTQLGGAARRPARLLLTGLAVLVVSFVVYATVLAQQITERTVLNGLSGTPEAVDLVVRDGEVTAARLAAISRLPGVAETAGRVEVGRPVGNDYLQVSADSSAGPLALTRLAAGRLPAAPGEVAVTPRTVERMGLRIGTTTTFDRTPVTVVGVVTVRDDYGYQAYAPLPSVTALGGTGQLSQIDVRLADGADAAAVRRRIAGVAAGAQVVTGAEVRLAEARAKSDEVDGVFGVVALFVAVAVVAAGLVAASTFRIVFAQRMRQLALLRAVGAGRAALSWSLAAEGAFVGLVTGTTGVLLALAAGHLVPPLLAAVGPHVEPPGVPLAAAAGTVLLAVVITTVAVVAPAYSAGRVSPLEALRGASTTGARSDIGRPRWIAGLLLVAVAGALAALVVTRLPARDAENYAAAPVLLGVVASGGLAFLALIALGPALVRPILAVLGAPVRRWGPLGRLAAGGVGGAPRRAAAVSVVVALGVTLVAGVLVGGASIRVLADRETAASAPADFELTPVGDGTVPAARVAELRTRPELTHVTPYRRLEVRVAGTGMGAIDLAPGALPAMRTAFPAPGPRAGRVVLSAMAADVTGLRVGDPAEVTAGGRTVRLTVAAELPDMGPLGSGVVLDPADLTRLGAGADDYAGVLADAARSGERGRTEGRTALTTAGTKVEVLADKRDQINSSLTVLLAIALALIGLTVLIAVVGVGTTTALSVVERVRESGLLRAVGLSRGGLRLMLTTESALYGVIGAAVGLLLGVPYAWLAVRALGVNAPLTLPAGQLALVFAILVLLTAAAGVLPARRAAKVSPVAALGTE